MHSIKKGTELIFELKVNADTILQHTHGGRVV